MTEKQKQMITDHHNLIYGFIHKHSLIKNDKTDVSCWYGILSLALVKAGMTWNEARGKFSQYAWGVMENAYKDEIKSRKNQKRNAIVISLDTPINIDSNGTRANELVTLADVIPDNSSDNDLESYVINKIMFINVFAALSQRDEIIVESKMNSNTNREIAKKIGCSEQYIGYLLRGIRKKVSAYFD